MSTEPGEIHGRLLTTAAKVYAPGHLDVYGQEQAKDWTKPERSHRLHAAPALAFGPDASAREVACRALL